MLAWRKQKFYHVFLSLLNVNDTLKPRQLGHMRMSTTYLLKRAFYNVTNSRYFLGLPHSMDPRKGLLLDCRVPLRLHNVSSGCGCYIEAVSY
jgi:hypothetical protein